MRTLIWENIKSNIREATQHYTRQKAQRINKTCIALERELAKLHKYQDENQVVSETLKTQILNIENRLEDIYTYRAKGAQIRTRVEWTVKGLKSQNTFSALRKANK